MAYHYRSRKSKDEIVNQPHTTKIVEIRAFFVSLKESKIPVLVFDSAHKSLLVILITFFDSTKIRNVTAC